MSTRIQILKDGVITVVKTANDRQLALNSLVSTMTANRVLRSNGTNLVLAQVDLSTDVIGVLPPANGGSGNSASYVDLTTSQTIGGSKTFSDGLVLPTTVHTSVGAIWRNGANLEFRNSANATQVLLNSAGNLSNLADKQISLNTLAGAVTSGTYLRGNGTNVILSTIQANDIPTLNQNTTGTASNITGTVLIGNGGTGTTTRQAAINSLVGTQTANRVLRSDGTNSVLGQVVLTSDVTGSLPIANGGTGSSTQNFVDLTTAQTITGVKSMGPELRVINSAYPKIVFNGTGYGTDLKKFQMFVDPNGDFYFAPLNDAENSSPGAFVIKNNTNIVFNSGTQATSSTAAAVTATSLGLTGNLFVAGTRINLSNLPTSSSGLPAGTLWRNGNVVNIV